MSEYFKKYGDRVVGLGVDMDGELVIMQSGTLEEMYQAFKERLLAEMKETEIKPGV